MAVDKNSTDVQSEQDFQTMALQSLAEAGGGVYQELKRMRDAARTLATQQQESGAGGPPGALFQAPSGVTTQADLAGLTSSLQAATEQVAQQLGPSAAPSLGMNAGAAGIAPTGSSEKDAAGNKDQSA